MNPQEFYYSVEPKMKSVSKEEYEKFLEDYPRKLRRDVNGISEPPSITFNDFELADRWPYSVVARSWVYSDNPVDYYYSENPSFYIMENYEEVFNSRTGNKTDDSITVKEYNKNIKDKKDCKKFAIKNVTKISFVGEKTGKTLFSWCPNK